MLAHALPSSRIAMQLSETITIYLAIAAPFGVNRFLREHAGKEHSRARSLFRATSTGLLWPFVAISAFLSQLSPAASSTATGETENSLDETARKKIATARHQLFAALERVRKLAQTAAGAGEELEQSVRTVRESVEKYVGLTLALAETDLNDSPKSREMELCRIAGRSGDDLLLAGRCIHRRNVARLIAHQARSRITLLHALAAVREINDGPIAESSPELAAARHLSVARLRFYGQAISLLSLLEDESAARSVARLLDAECASLRRLEALSLKHDETVMTDGKHAGHTHADSAVLARS
jgi:hypothetical protein